MKGKFGKEICFPGWRWEQSKPFKRYVLWFITGGKGEVWVNGHYFALRRGSFLFMRPDELHTAAQDPKNRLSDIYTHFLVVDDRTNAEMDAEFLLPRHTFVEDYYFIESLLHRLLDVQDSGDDWAEDEFNLIMKQLMLHIYRLQNEEGEGRTLSKVQIQNLRKVIKHIRNANGHCIDFNELSELAAVSPQYLNRLFKQYTGLSLKRFIIRTKMERATFLLGETPMSITEISKALQYSDIYSFSKVFKSFYGTSPLNYKKQLRRSDRTS